MAITDQIPRDVSTAAPGATVFPYGFKIVSKGDLLVQVNGVTKTVDVDYTVSGVGMDTGGDITFLVAMAGGETVMRKRNMRYERLNDYQNLGDLRSPTLNNDQDAPIMMVQQLAEGLSRSMQLPLDSTASATLPTPAALQPLVWNAAGTGLENGSTTLTGDMLLRENLASADAGKGASLVMCMPAATGAVARSLQDKLNDIVSLKDFGAVGDGVADDSAAITAAVSYMASSGKHVYVPPGTYLTDPFSINTQLYTGQASFYGDDRERTVFKRRTNAVGPFVVLGSPAGTSFQSGVGFDSITIDGGVTTNGPALEGYDVVRTTFTNCRFVGGSDAVRLFGGISLTFRDCLAESALRGLKITKFTSLAGGGWPNLIRWIGGEIVDNAEWGVYFDDGRSLIFRDTDIEGNGTTLGAAQGGLYVGPNIGTEVIATDSFSLSVVLSGCWLEGNKGIADVHLVSGTASISDTLCFSTHLQTTHCIKVDGGRYMLRNVNCSFAKAANLLEGAGVGKGNIIDRFEASSLTTDPIKTIVINGPTTFIQYNNGRVMVDAGLLAPVQLSGTDNSGVNPTITFALPFKTGTVPRISMTVISNGAGTIDAPEAYNVSATGFTIRKKSYNGTTIGTANYQVDWTATGEAVGT